MSMSGLYEADEVVAGSLRLESFDLALLNPFTRLERDLAGRMTADVVVGGEPSSPAGEPGRPISWTRLSPWRDHSMHVAAAFSEGRSISSSGPAFQFRPVEGGRDRGQPGGRTSGFLGRRRP